MDYERLKEWIRQSDYDQSKIAKMMRLQQSNFCGMVNGYSNRNITIRQLETICDLIGYSPRNLFPK